VTACVLAITALIAACKEPPPPRTFAEFMDDRFAREGTLIRCDENHQQSANDIECANARRAAATIALRDERGRRQALEEESARKIAELRRRVELEQQRAAEAAARATAEAQAAYEAQWAELQRRMAVEGAAAAENVTILRPPTDTVESPEGSSQGAPPGEAP
jgi:antirestriction protein